MQIHFDLNSLPQFNNAVITIGSFDGVHLGHKTLLDQVKAVASKHHGESIVITFDPHPRLVLEGQPKNFALLTNLDEKVSLLSKHGIDHLVIVPFTKEFSQLSATSYLHNFLLHYFKPTAIVVGYDHKYGTGRVGDFDLMRKELNPLGIEIIEIDPLLIEQIAISSSAIRRGLEEGKMRTVNEQLGYPFFIRGTVVKGDQIGRRLGFPTANLSLKDPYKAIPLNGIYAAKVKIDNTLYDGMAYIGHRPVVGNNLARVIEVNIFNFEVDLYDTEIDLQLIEFIRKDVPLSNLDELKNQLFKDKAEVIKFYSKTSNKTLYTTAVIVLNYNGLKHLKTYLPELIKYTQDADIIIADNGSTDDSVAFLQSEYPEIQLLLFDKNYGFCGGYNKAINLITQDLVLLLNSDVRGTSGWLEPLLERLLSNEQVAIVQPKVLNDIQKELFDYAGGAGGWIDDLGYPFCKGRIFDDIEKDEHQYDNAEQVFWASGAAMLIRRSLYIKAGGLEEGFFAHMEEIDLAWRVKNMGYEVWAEPASIVFHLGGGTLDATSPKKTYLNFRNSLFVLVKNIEDQVIIRILARLCLDGVAGIRFLLQGKFSFFLAILKAHLHFYMGLNYYLKRRKENKVFIKRFTIGPPNDSGLLKRSLIWSYFIKKQKTFTAIQSQK